MDFLLGALGNEDADNLPHCTIEEVCTQHVERLQSLRVVVIKDGHKLLHALLGNVIRLSHAPPIVYNTELVSF